MGSDNVNLLPASQCLRYGGSLNPFLCLPLRGLEGIVCLPTARPCRTSLNDARGFSSAQLKRIHYDRGVNVMRGRNERTQFELQICVRSKKVASEVIRSSAVNLVVGRDALPSSVQANTVSLCRRFPCTKSTPPLRAGEKRGEFRRSPLTENSGTYLREH